MLSRFPKPDAVFLLDVDPIVGIDRIANDRGGEPNHFEDRTLAAARSIFNQMRDVNSNRSGEPVGIDERIDVFRSILCQRLRGAQFRLFPGRG
jgi:thymidylate kinase